MRLRKPRPTCRKLHPCHTSARVIPAGAHEPRRALPALHRQVPAFAATQVVRSFMALQMHQPPRMDVALSAGASRFRLGEVSIDPLTFEQAIDAIERLVDLRRGGAVFTPNVDHIVRAGLDPHLREAYAHASLSLADGMPVIWASHLLGRPLPAKVSGSDLIDPLMARAAARGWRVYLLGGAEGVAARAAERLCVRYRDLHVVGTSAPRLDDPLNDTQGELACLRVREAQPDLLLVGLGCPKQEVWSHRYAGALRPTVVVCVGGSFDFVTGRVKRAPRWMSTAGMEWLFRFAQEPRRLFGRYFVRGPRFLSILARAWWGGLGAGSRGE